RAYLQAGTLPRQRHRPTLGRSFHNIQWRHSSCCPPDQTKIERAPSRSSIGQDDGAVTAAFTEGSCNSFDDKATITFVKELVDDHLILHGIDGTGTIEDASAYLRSLQGGSEHGKLLDG